MSQEALIRLSLIALTPFLVRAAIMYFIYPHYKRLEDRSRAKAEERLTNSWSLIEQHRRGKHRA